MRANVPAALMAFILLTPAQGLLSPCRAPRYSGQRTAQGQIKRSAAARLFFKKQTGYPRGRPGYVIDHVIPLACGGADRPFNMQWQTREQAKIKDRAELRCGGKSRPRPKKVPQS